MVIEEDFSFASLQPSLDLCQRQVPVVAPLKIDRHTEKVFAPSVRVVLDQAIIEIILSEVLHLFIGVVDPSEQNDRDQV